MSGSWRVNAILGLPAFFFTYLFSYVNNTWQISLFRATIGFILFFILGYIVRLILYQSAYKKNSSLTKNQNTELNTSKDEAEENQADEGQMDGSSFQTIPLHSLHNGDSVEDTDKKTKIIRTWTSQNQEG